MKKQISYLVLATLSVGLFFTSCKKTENSATVDNSVELQQQADDHARFASETDATTNDANAAIENVGGSYAGETPLTPQLPFTCDATIAVDTTSTPRKITITYNGSNCIGNRTRAGVVIISFAPEFRWVKPNATYSITYQNLKITRKSDNKGITINGTKTITNVSGGRLRNLATRLDPIVHEVTSASMNVIFDDGTQRNWQIAKRHSFTYNNGIVISTTGISNLGGGISEWGVNRNNNNFTSAILEPLVVKQSCDFRLVSGTVKHTLSIVNTTIMYGLDANGSPVTSCPSGPLYYKVTWTGVNGMVHTYISPY
jgi:hypothetical protein